jgi:hypothetical protein
MMHRRAAGSQRERTTTYPEGLPALPWRGMAAAILRGGRMSLCGRCAGRSPLVCHSAGSIRTSRGTSRPVCRPGSASGIGAQRQPLRGERVRHLPGEATLRSSTRTPLTAHTSLPYSERRDRRNREPVGIRISGVGAPEWGRAGGNGVLHRLRPEGSSGHPGRRRFSEGCWARSGKGKSSGFRVVYFFLDEPGRIYMAAIYAKSRKETLSAADRNVLAKLAAQIKKAAEGGR